MRDLSPGQMAVFRLVEGICRDCFIKWGYREVKTPTIEYLHLFTSAGTLTPGRLGRVYSFLDWDGWSGERVVLRPDGTIPVARLYTDSMIGGGLARLFYVTNIFMFEETGEQARERWQCGAELIGAGSSVADAELIALSSETLVNLGLKGARLKLSHAGLIKALLQKLGLSAEEQHKTFDLILDGDAAALAKIGKESPELESILRPLLSPEGQSADFLRERRSVLARAMPEIVAPLDDFLNTAALLDDLGIEYQVNISSGAGFEYYTGIIFQFFSGGEKIGGGGRYDALIPAMGGGDIPASGFALYLDGLMGLVESEASGPSTPERIIVRPASGEAVKAAFETADQLRHAGFIAEIDLDGKKSTTGRTVEVAGKSPSYIIIEKSGRRNFGTIDELLRGLGGSNAG